MDKDYSQHSLAMWLYTQTVERSRVHHWTIKGLGSKWLMISLNLVAENNNNACI